MRERVKGGDYLGEISALCFLKVPSTLSPLPYLLAGSGSQIVLYDVNEGRLVDSFVVFEGLRVHGIAAAAASSSLSSPVIVSGERTVKLFSLQLNRVSAPKLELVQLLPRFTHWVLDFSFFKHNDDECRYIALASSDNALHIWDTLHSSFILENIQCPERCLVYSIKMWGHSLDSLLIASGTIFNQIVVWKLVLEAHSYKPLLVSTLSGHQGSIFCLSWSADASILVSVSDDRSARMWITDTDTKFAGDSRILNAPFLAGPMLFGHGARVWDCCISDSLIATAGEDCTCRLWGLDGRELGVIKEHTGRGIWRCLYDPNSSLLVTAGFDSSIKVHYLPTSSMDKSIQELNDRKAEVFIACIPNLSGRTRLMDSKSEYVRCLKCARKDTIYVATNHGCVYHAKLTESGSVEWTDLVRVTDEVPVICLDLLSKDVSELSPGVEDWVAIGDGRGSMKIIKVLFCDGTPKVAAFFSWSAETERQLLGAYWCRSLGCRFIFTSNPRGLVKLWRLSVPLSDGTMTNCHVTLVVDFMSPFGARIMSLDASFEEEILVCGDVRGNVVLFPFLRSILLDASPQAAEFLSALTYFKGAHGISSVSSITIARFSSSLVDICSTGGDGCICYLEYNKDRKTLEFVGMRQTKELSLVQSISADHYSLNGSANICYAVGFSSTDFLIWNLVSETKVLQVKCGGWRRPHSYYLGISPEAYSSFVFVKDDLIYIHKYRVPDGEKKKFPRNLHVQYHGREIHSLCIISEELRAASNRMHSLCPKSSWIATGCEDGTVRLTRYDHDAENWAMSNLLGEHVGGSAVRSICFVTKIYSSEAKVVEAINGTCETDVSSDNFENPSLLISVGAKRVLTSWLLRNRQMNGGDSVIHDVDRNPSLVDLSAVSFKWLSTDMPVKSVHSRKRAEHAIMSLKGAPGAESTSVSTELESTKQEDAQDNDWRYLAVTAFLVRVAESRLTVCFVVVACSDATLMLRALVLPYRYWFDIASLAPLSSPVLALQHAVTPLSIPNEGVMVTKNIYIVISGSTDGSIAFWDLTENVEAFLQRVPSLYVENAIDFQKRPRTGRGSQGGRWRKSIDASVTARRTGACMTSANEPASCDDVVADRSPVSLNPKGDQTHADGVVTATCGVGGKCDDSFLRSSEIKPLHILYNVHQSGVNCLHICCHQLDNSSRYSIVSGGDDQALCFLQLVVAPHMIKSNVDKTGNGHSESKTAQHPMHYYSKENYSIKFLSLKKVLSAHSSAVKGVWTDGIWAFSTGLDQRVRCWNHQNNDNVTEYSHFITSVPEPETLDVRVSGR